MSDEIEKISGVSKAGKKDMGEKMEELQDMQRQSEFDDAMSNANTKAPQQPMPTEQVKETAKVEQSPMDAMKTKHAGEPTPVEKVEMASRNASDKIDQLNTQMSQYSDLDVPKDAPVRGSMHRTIDHVDTELQAMHDTAGVEFTPIDKGPDIGKPIEQFLHYLTGSQEKMNKFPSLIAELKSKNESLSPADMLLVQNKMHRIQEEVEFFTNALNQALQSMKTVMNVQV